MGKTALIAIDMINNYEHPDAELLISSAERAVPRIVRLIKGPSNGMSPLPATSGGAWAAKVHASPVDTSPTDVDPQHVGRLVQNYPRRRLLPSGARTKCAVRILNVSPRTSFAMSPIKGYIEI